MSRPVGLRFGFDEPALRTTVDAIDIKTVPDLASGLPLWQRVATILEQDGPQSPAQLAGTLGVKSSTVQRLTRRMPRRFRQNTDPKTERVTIMLTEPGPRKYFVEEPATAPPSAQSLAPALTPGGPLPPLKKPSTARADLFDEDPKW